MTVADAGLPRPCHLGAQLVDAERAQVRDLDRRRREQPPVQLDRRQARPGASAAIVREHLQVLLERCPTPGSRCRTSPRCGAARPASACPTAAAAAAAAPASGCTSAFGMVKNRPANSTGSGPQQATRASISSSQRAPRVRGIDVHDLVLLVGPADAEAGDEPAARTARRWWTAAARARPVGAARPPGCWCRRPAASSRPPPRSASPARRARCGRRRAPSRPGRAE